jgi:sugar phosphate isomerase/epimerase
MQPRTVDVSAQPVTLSTMWGVGRFAHLNGFFAAGQRLGFQQFELNHQVDSAMLAGVDLGAVRIASVHEPCPSDIPPPELHERGWLVSSPDEEQRRQGVRAVQRSIDLARDVGAGLVVVHPGRVDVHRDQEGALRDRARAGQAGTPGYQAQLAQLLAARAARAPANLDAALRSLRELAAYAGRDGIRLGVENRFHILDIPSLDEMAPCLSLVGEDRIGFLYDVGHAQVLEFLGAGPHRAWLERYAHRMVGVHLHDARGLYDHIAPGQGEVDWGMVGRHLPPGAQRTCELRMQLSPQEIEAGLRVLVQTGCLAGEA